MSAHLRLSRFDSEALELKTGKLGSVGSIEEFNAALSEAQQQQFRLLLLDGPKEFPFALEESALPVLRLSDKLHFSASCDALLAAASAGRPACGGDDTRIEQLELGRSASGGLRSLALLAGRHSHFRTDPSLTRRQYEALYTAWIENTARGAVADAVFLCYCDVKGEDVAETPLAFISAKIEKERASISLLAVREEGRRKGVARRLLQRCCAWAQNEGATEVTVATQRCNAAARAFYESVGFTENGASSVYHVWLPVTGSIPHNRPYITGREMHELQDMFRARALESNGTRTARATQWLKEKLHARTVLLMGSCTAALDEAAILCELGPGDEVIVPSYTFVSTANCVALRGASLVFVDVRRDTLNIDETKIEAAITQRTKVIIVVHYAGVACEMDSIMRIAQQHSLLVVEDCAQAMGSTYKGRPLGTIGDIGALSFHYTKNVMCGEGGALLLKDSEHLEHRAHIVWEKGTNRFDFLKGLVSSYRWMDIGSSFVPTELSAAVLLPQLEESEEINAKRLRIVRVYQRALRPVVASGALEGMLEDHRHRGIHSNGHLFWVMFASTAQRQEAQAGMKAAGVACYTHYVPLHSAPAGSKYGRCAGGMSVTDDAGSKLLRLPVWPEMCWQHVNRIVTSFLRVLRQEAIPANTVFQWFHDKDDQIHHHYQRHEEQ